MSYKTCNSYNTDAKGDKVNTWIEKDLTKELTLFITDTIIN